MGKLIHWKGKSKNKIHFVEETIRQSIPVLPGECTMELQGNREVTIDGGACIVSYHDTCVILQTKQGNLLIRGKGLHIGALDQDFTTVSGTISSLELDY